MNKHEATLEDGLTLALKSDINSINSNLRGDTDKDYYLNKSYRHDLYLDAIIEYKQSFNKDIHRFADDKEYLFPHLTIQNLRAQPVLFFGTLDRNVAKKSLEDNVYIIDTLLASGVDSRHIVPDPRIIKLCENHPQALDCFDIDMNMAGLVQSIQIPLEETSLVLKGLVRESKIYFYDLE